MPEGMIKLPSASRLTLAMKCMGSYMLPQVGSEPGEAAEKGTAIHGALAKFIETGKATDDGADPVLEREYDTICRRAAKSVGMEYDPHGQTGMGSRPELGLLLSPGEWSARVLSAAELRDERETRTGYLAICDLVTVKSESECEIWDWKTGASYVAAPEWNWQLILPAICLWAMAERPAYFHCKLGICHVRESAINSDDLYDCESFDADAAYLAERERCLRRSYMQYLRFGSNGETVPLYEGKHCEYCPAAARCPAKIGALGSAVLTANANRQDVRGADHIESDRWIAKAATTLIECGPQIKKTAVSVLERHGGVLDLGDGREAVLAADGRGKKKVFTRKKTDDK